MSENQRGILLMVAAMAGFAFEDMFVKILSGSLPVGQILVMLGTSGTLVFAALLRLRGARLFTRSLLAGPVLLRNLGELVGTTGYVSAIALTPLSSASAILQAVPLATVLGAALFLQEPVGWRRWSAVLAGFAGVVMVVQPGLDGFEPASLLAVIGVMGLATRDLATRRIPRDVQSLQLSASAFAVTVPAGALLLLLTGEPPQALSPANWGQLGGAICIGTLAYMLIVGATRIGEISVVTPLRYSRLVFAMAIGITVFGERPDTLTFVGGAVIVASGLYAIFREAQARRRARASLAPQGTL